MSKSLVFIVEDDPAFCKFLNVLLEQNGYDNLMSFDSGEECIQELKKKPSYVFLDFSLNGLNGLDTLKKIKKKLPKTMVFIITSLDDEEVKSNCLNNGATLFFNKMEILKGFPSELQQHMN
jgi:DNA-binding response OmpR family regulator